MSIYHTTLYGITQDGRILLDVEDKNLLMFEHRENAERYMSSIISVGGVEHPVLEVVEIQAYEAPHDSIR
jgi:hypothetical protein